MTRFRMEGIDCPVCAQGLEDGLRKFEGVKGVTVDFATLTLHVDALDLAAVEAEAKRLEPGLGLLRIGSESRASVAAQPEAASQGWGRGWIRDLLPIASAASLAIFAFLLERRAPAGLQPWALALPYYAAWLIAGKEVLLGALRNIGRGRIFDELFLMSIATIGAMLIGQYEEAVGVMVLYRLGEFLQESAIERSRSSMRSLLDLRPALARIKKGAEWLSLPSESVEAGDLLLVLPGEAVPADGGVEAGESLVDTKTLTGESAPRSAEPGSELMGGFIVLDGALEIRASRPVSESQASRVAALVEEASARKAKTERLVTRLASWYTPLVVALAALVAFVPPLFIHGARLADWGYRALVMLVISCPCALVISIPLGYFAGIGGAARAGILVKGGEVIDALARVGTVVFDKTGTLTEGSFEVIGIEVEEGRSETELVSLAAAAEARSTHPLARALVKEAERRAAPTESIAESREYPGRGLVATIGGREVLVGNSRLLGENAKSAKLPAERQGATSLYVAIDGSYAGRFLLGDRMKGDAADSLSELAALGVHRMAMLTGDAAAPAQKTADALGIAEVKTALTPEGKLRELEAIMKSGAARRGDRGAVMFVGDGTNDAPVIARADVGVALGAGTDAAVETADVVLLSRNLDRVPAAVRHARRTKRIIAQNIVFALGIKSAFLALGAAGLAGMWFAVIADVGVALLAVLNSTRALSSRRAGSSSFLRR
ncbi:MAG TPA: heavy metal translocating P-type ATPase [Rectinemataceae bacterium]|nr:heavy metal translocating P-type ATPase [Rectinemataceae bacterium]